MALQPGTHTLGDKRMEMRRNTAVLEHFRCRRSTSSGELAPSVEGGAAEFRPHLWACPVSGHSTTLCVSSLYSQRSLCREVSLADPFTEAAH